MFIDRLRESSSLCVHPNDAFDLISVGGTDMCYRCRTCEHTVSVTDFLCRVVSPEWSATLAREFATETGIVDVPCRFRVDHIEKRLMPETVVTRLSTVIRGLEILKAIHSPFCDRKDVDPKLFKNLLSEYMSLIDRVSLKCDEGDSTSETVKLILTNMKDAFSNVDMFDQYFHVLVPYVTRAAGAAAENLPPMSKIDALRREPLGIALQGELALSAAIRNTYSPYCVPFDVVHAMVLCYLCGDHVDLVYNIVLDFAARLCCGFFSFPVSRVFRTGIEIRKFLEHHIVPSKNFRLAQHLKKYREDVSEYFEEKFLKCYGDLEQEIRKHVPLAESSDKLERFIYQQTFPYMLFEKPDNDFDYYAFVMALAHFASKSSRGSSKTAKLAQVAGTSVPKGVERECKRVYRFVKRCMGKVREFSTGEEEGEVFCWTKQAFELFVASDPHFAKELVDIINVMMPSVSR